MGDQEREVWDLTLQLEGLSLRLSRSRGVPPGPTLTPNTRASSPSAEPQGSFSVISRATSASAPVPGSASSLPPAFATGLSPPVGSPSAPQAGPGYSPPTAYPASCPARGSSHPVGSPSACPPGPSPVIASASAVPEYPLPGSRDLTFEQRQRLALSFPSVPDSCIALCRSLQVTELSAEERAARAWTAGCWAGAVLRGEVLKPDPSLSFNQPSRFYCILRASGLSAPAVCASLGAYRRLVGVNIAQAVSHGFPSTSECRVYFSAAGLPYPAHLTR